MIEPVTTFRDPQGAPLRRWAVKAGMLITDVNYDARSGCLDVTVEGASVVRRADPARAAHCRPGAVAEAFGDDQPMFPLPKVDYDLKGPDDA